MKLYGGQVVECQQSHKHHISWVLKFHHHLLLDLSTMTDSLKSIILIRNQIMGHGNRFQIPRNGQSKLLGPFIDLELLLFLPAIISL